MRVRLTGGKIVDETTGRARRMIQAGEATECDAPAPKQPKSTSKPTPEPNDGDDDNKPANPRPARTKKDR